MQSNHPARHRAEAGRADPAWLRLAAALVPGRLAAPLLDRYGRGLRSVGQVERALGLPALGLVPRVGEDGREPHERVVAEPHSAYAEAVRAVHASLELSDVDRPPKVVLVAASLPGEGASTLAASLAAFAANGGSRRVLLLDLDFREKAAAAIGGVVEYLAGERTLDAVVRHHAGTGLDYLAAGRRTADPAGLLAGEEIWRLMARLRALYDYVVVDAAPVLDADDTPLAAALLADKVLFAARWETTGREEAADGLARLREVGASVAGAVLTRVDVARHARYGYGDLDRYYGKYESYHAG